MACDVQNGTRLLRLSQTRFGDALRSGLTPEAMRQRLQCVTQQPLPARTDLLLRKWAAQFDEVRLREVVILETRERETLTALSHDRGVSAHFQQTLSPRAVIIQRDRVPTLEKRLAKLGHALPPLNSKRLATRPARAAGADKRSADSHLYLAALTYAQLGNLIALPDYLPADLLDAFAFSPLRSGARPSRTRRMSTASVDCSGDGRGGALSPCCLAALCWARRSTADSVVPVRTAAQSSVFRSPSAFITSAHSQRRISSSTRRSCITSPTRCINSSWSSVSKHLGCRRQRPSDSPHRDVA